VPSADDEQQVDESIVGSETTGGKESSPGSGDRRPGGDTSDQIRSRQDDLDAPLAVA
jgi:hypothetical protein